MREKSGHTGDAMTRAADLVIVGNGMAANRLLQELVKQPKRPTSVLVIGKEPRPAYNRVLLSPLLAGEKSAAEVELQGRDWYRDHGIELLCDDPVLRLDPAAHALETRAGVRVSYRRLVLATGSRAAMPAVPGVTLDGVMGFRNWSDVERMQRAAQRGGRALVIGGGLLGLEAAEGLRKLGMATAVVQRSDWLLNRQLDRTAAALLRETLEARGLQVHTGAGLEAIEGEQGRVRGVLLKDGRRLPAELVVVAAGITPEVGLAREAGIGCDRAIRVDAQLRTDQAEVYALGECCEFDGHTYGLVAPIWRQAQVLAAVLCGASAAYREQAVATQLKVSGIELFSCGEIDAGDAETLEYLDRALGEYRKLWLRDNRLVGAVLYGDTRLGHGYFEQLLAQRDLSAGRASLLYDPAPAAAGAGL